MCFLSATRIESIIEIRAKFEPSVNLRRFILYERNEGKKYFDFLFLIQTKFASMFTNEIFHHRHPVETQKMKLLLHISCFAELHFVALPWKTMWNVIYHRNLWQLWSTQWKCWADLLKLSFSCSLELLRSMTIMTGIGLLLHWPFCFVLSSE